MTHRYLFIDIDGVLNNITTGREVLLANDYIATGEPTNG